MSRFGLKSQQFKNISKADRSNAIKAHAAASVDHDPVMVRHPKVPGQTIVLPPLAALLTERARRSFKEFVSQAWSVLEPGTVFCRNFATDAVCDHAQAVAEGKRPIDRARKLIDDPIRDLIINIPPRHAKSMIMAVFFPAWVWINWPEKRFMFLSFSHEFTKRDSRKTRQLINSEWYQSRWGDRFAISEDSNTLIRFDNDKGGFRYAVSFNGQVTGEGADIIVCLYGDELVYTDAGHIAIRDIVENKLDVKVMGPKGWQNIDKYEKNPGRPCLEVETSDGRKIKCTEDHPFFVEGRGYIRAKDMIGLLNDGTKLYLRSLPKKLLRESFSRKQEQKENINYLQLEMCERIQSDGSNSERGMSGLQEYFLSSSCAPSEKSDGNILQQEMLLRMGDWKTKSSLCWREARSTVQMLPKHFLSRSKQDNRRKKIDSIILFERMSFQNDECKQSNYLLLNLQKRISKELLHATLLLRLPNIPSRSWIHAWSQGIDHETRQQRLRIMYKSRNTSVAKKLRPSYRRQENLSSTNKSSNTLLSLPCESSCRKTSSECGVHDKVWVHSIQSCPIPDFVYNLKVSPGHAYYANGILTHNCDDANNMGEIHSKKKRENVTNKWSDVISSRLSDPKTGCRIIIAQRGHGGDLTGYIIDNDKEKTYVHLRLPAEFEAKYRCTTRLPWSDPRTKEGQLIDERRFGPKEIARLKADMKSAFNIAAQLQQRPVPLEGGIFEHDWWRYYKRSELPPISSWLESCLSVDMTFGSVRDEASFCVFQAWARVGAKFYLLGQKRGQWKYTKAKKELKSFIRRFHFVYAIYVENKALGPAIMDELMEEDGLSGIIPVDPKNGAGGGDKVARAHSVSPLIEAGNCFLPDPEEEGNEWVTLELLAELDLFPMAANDDQVDTLTQALRKLRGSAAFGTSPEDVEENVWLDTEILAGEKMFDPLDDSYLYPPETPLERHEYSEKLKKQLLVPQSDSFWSF